jgi:FkbM family methyltransferase
MPEPLITTVTLDVLGRKVPFRFPNSGNVQQHLQSILSGREYPAPPLPPGYRINTIVDIGANVGASALWFLSAAPQARVVCFEPARTNYDCLCHNLKSFPQAEYFQCGLSSSEGSQTLHHGAQQCMQHSIFASIETGEGSETINIKRASTEFDRLGLKQISILKIDTEGCEVQIIDDLGARLEGADIIYIEWHSEEDRRVIDDLLGKFILAQSLCAIPHRGNATYLAKRIAEAVPNLSAVRIKT